MADYIKREDIIKWIDDSVAQCGNRYDTSQQNMMDLFRTVVNDCLAFADVVPREHYESMERTVYLLNKALAELAECKTGTWRKKHDDICYWYECSVCGNKPLHTNWTISEVLSNYCPYCGTKMKGISQ